MVWAGVMGGSCSNPVSARNWMRRIVAEGRGFMQLGWAVAVAVDDGSYAHDVKNRFVWLALTCVLSDLPGPGKERKRDSWPGSGLGCHWLFGWFLFRVRCYLYPPFGL